MNRAVSIAEFVQRAPVGDAIKSGQRFVHLGRGLPSATATTAAKQPQRRALPCPGCGKTVCVEGG